MESAGREGCAAGRTGQDRDRTGWSGQDRDRTGMQDRTGRCGGLQSASATIAGILALFRAGSPTTQSEGTSSPASVDAGERLAVAGPSPRTATKLI